MTQFAFVFPGQGSQTVGMLADIHYSHNYPGFTIPVCFYDLLPAAYIDILLPCIQHTELKYLPVIISFFRWE